MNHTDPTADTHVAEARRAVHESLILLPAWEADRVRALIADLETAVEGRAAMRAAASVVMSPPTSRADLRDRIADAIWARYPDAEPSRTGLVMANPHALADAVLAVLPEPTGQAAEVERWQRKYDAEHARHMAVVGALVTDRAALLLGAADELEAPYEPESGYDRGRAWCVAELRRLAAEAQQQARCSHGCDVTRCPCLACEADDTEAGPDRCSGCRYVPCGNCAAPEAPQLPPMDPVHILGIDADAPTPAEQQPAAADDDGETRGGCGHGPERHGPEAGCVECRCPSTTGHA
ncbi:hypothetical protein [Streptomyces sp. NPDC003720]|uniref:hypothetical protein n=1 Tax=Streptomyces sp. NPDC003720 TaxID=3364684 RepID=UPI0036A6A40A